MVAAATPSSSSTSHPDGMPPKTVLVVDDEERLVALLDSYLTQQGFRVVTASNGVEALDVARRERPDLIVLDWMMPGLDGLGFLTEHRQESETPIIVLTARVDDDDKVVGLELGADDYVTKPFGLRELLARIRAVLRRPGPRQKFEEFAFGDARLRLRGRQAFKAGREVKLTRKEFDLLRYLVEHPGEVITRDRLLDEVWGYDQFPTTRTVDTHVLRLRQKFEEDPEHPRHILTAHGQGYRFLG